MRHELARISNRNLREAAIAALFVGVIALSLSARPRFAVSVQPRPSPRAPAFETSLVPSPVPIGVATEDVDESSAGMRITAKVPRTEDARAIEAKLLRELNRYPQSLLARLNVDRFLLVSDLRCDALECGGLTVLEHRHIFLEADSSDWITSTFPGILHHEIMHAIDGTAGCDRSDAAWEALNPKSFRYEGNEFVPLPVGKPKPGFATAYATSTVSEDRCELFKMAMIEPNELLSRIHTDRVLAAKLSLLESRLRQIGPLPKGWPNRRKRLFSTYDL
ncbi:hypothetical protein [Fimbriimonas ginsengisoli]|uniref:Lipoprotein n=1 Tax=Fimbriimonas ginsengisoli Gsoil 348 TaxID=661478 RepID=A0A068NS87_FIMGI|nr:hypothetical protein [Fimbriimonas ginsengisoli]AIE86413.1 lipoprotein [Fimbriimonas ginsengisoli Gsoil 348]